jgi:hypothetical protein
VALLITCHDENSTVRAVSASSIRLWLVRTVRWIDFLRASAFLTLSGPVCTNSRRTIVTYVHFLCLLPSNIIAHCVRGKNSCIEIFLHTWQENFGRSMMRAVLPCEQCLCRQYACGFCIQCVGSIFSVRQPFLPYRLCYQAAERDTTIEGKSSVTAVPENQPLFSRLSAFVLFDPIIKIHGLVRKDPQRKIFCHSQFPP